MILKQKFRLTRNVMVRMIAREKMKCNMFVNTSDVGIGVSRHLSDSSMSRSVAENIFIKFSQKLHEIEKNLVTGGASLAPPRSATVPLCQEVYVNCLR